MLYNITRRRRWWQLLQQLDETVGLSAEIRGDLLLDNAGLVRHEELIILTSADNDTDFDKVAGALQAQHGKGHENKRRGYGPGQSRWRQAAYTRPVAHMAQA